MKRLFAALTLLLAPLALAATAPRTLELYGPATNTTVEITANLRLTLVIDGERVAARVKTEPPLSGTGALEGRFVGGWCELEGKLDGGIILKFRGVLNARDFRGTYLAAVPDTPLQYGKFLLVLQPAEPSRTGTSAKP